VRRAKGNRILRAHAALPVMRELAGARKRNARFAKSQGMAPRARFGVAIRRGELTAEGQNKSKCPVWCRLHETRRHFSSSSRTQSCTQTQRSARQMKQKEKERCVFPSTNLWHAGQINRAQAMSKRREVRAKYAFVSYPKDWRWRSYRLYRCGKLGLRTSNPTRKMPTEPAKT